MKGYVFNKLTDEEAELSIYGDIVDVAFWSDSEVTAYDFKKELDEVNGKNLTVRINSYGGEVSNGLAIYNLLKSRNGQTKTICDGYACSIASVIFMAGTERVMNHSSLLMVHNAWGLVQGNSDDLRKQADDLDKINSTIVNVYLDNTNLSETEIKELMSNESWLTAYEALEKGFATKVDDHKDDAQMSAKDSCIYNLVMKNKELEKEVLDLQNVKEEPKPEVNFWENYFKKGE